MTGDNGLLTKTETVVQSNKNSQEEEKIKLSIATAQLAGQGTITTENLNNELRDNFNDDSINIEETSNGWRYNKYEIYKDGTVKIKVYLYNNGDECTGLTGGWGTNINSIYTVYPVTKNSDRMLLYGRHAALTIAITNFDIDVTNYNYICFELKSISTSNTYPNVVMSLVENRNSHRNSVQGSQYENNEIGEKVTCVKDINNINGSYSLMYLVNGLKEYKSELLSVWLESDLN